MKTHPVQHVYRSPAGAVAREGALGCAEDPHVQDERHELIITILSGYVENAKVQSTTMAMGGFFQNPVVAEDHDEELIPSRHSLIDPIQFNGERWARKGVHEQRYFRIGRLESEDANNPDGQIQDGVSDFSVSAERDANTRVPQSSGGGVGWSRTRGRSRTTGTIG